MSKPEDISQEAWDAADVEFNWTSKSKDGDIIQALRAQIARAIMAATLAEREACEAACEMESRASKRNGLIHEALGALWCASAIRDRSKPLPNPLDPQ